MLECTLRALPHGVCRARHGQCIKYSYSIRDAGSSSDAATFRDAATHGGFHWSPRTRARALRGCHSCPFPISPAPMSAAGKGLVVITGASSGIGEATARAFSEAGHPLLLLARRVDRMESLGLSNTLCRSVDVADLATFSAAVEEVRGSLPLMPRGHPDTQFVMARPLCFTLRFLPPAGREGVWAGGVRREQCRRHAAWCERCCQRARARGREAYEVYAAPQAAWPPKIQRSGSACCR